MNLARLRTLYQINLGAIAVMLFAVLPPLWAGCSAIVVVCTFWVLFDHIVASAEKIVRLDVQHDIRWEPDAQRPAYVEHPSEVVELEDF
jgi:hypothetical protein